MNKKPIASEQPEQNAAVDSRRLRDRLTAVEAQLAQLDRAHRRSRMLGPMAFLVVASFTPLVGVTPAREAQQTFTLWQILHGDLPDAVDFSQLWFVLIALLGVVLFVGCLLLGKPDPGKRASLAVASVAGLLAFVLLLMVLALAVAGSASVALSGLQAATAIGVIAAVWVFATCVMAAD